MDNQQTTGNEGDRPQWLGSLVRRGDDGATTGGEPVFEESAGQWLGSVVRRGDGTAEQSDPSHADGWTGSPVRSAVFGARAPELPPAPDVAPVAAATVHELGASDRVVMGALGMTLRVAA